MIDGTINRQKSVSFSGHISDGLSVVSVRAEPHKGYVTERVRSSAAQCQSLAPRGMENLVTRRKAPRGYFTFSSVNSACKQVELLQPIVLIISTLDL